MYTQSINSDKHLPHSPCKVTFLDDDFGVVSIKLISPWSRGTAVLMAVAMLAGEGDGYCAGAGANPGFLSAPHVEQVSNGGGHVGGRG